MRVYAVGDIHGRLDLLRQLHSMIETDARAIGDRIRHIVYLGDYVDRGPDTRGVLDELTSGRPPGFGRVHLCGNHEASLLEFLNDPRIGPSWLHYGGAATLASYDVPLPEAPHSAGQIAAAQDRFRQTLPIRHRAFLETLKPAVTIGDYHFVHAGVRPGVPLDQQDARDLMWIREEFLSSHAAFGKIVVHGHTIRPEPDVRSNRIGIDTGAFATGRLTCLVLDGTDRRFLTTG